MLFPLDKNSDSTSRNEEFVVKNGRKKGFHQTENPFPLARIKNSFQKYVSTIRERTVTGMNVWKIDKKDGSHQPENPFPLTVMQYSLKSTFLLERKIKIAVAGESENGRKKGFPPARKSVSTTRNEAFVGKYVSTIHKICFFWHENQRKWFPLPGKCLSFNIGFPYWFLTAEKKL